MKKLLTTMALIVLIGLFLLNYTTIMTSMISELQYKESITDIYASESEPKKKIADISIAALYSIVPLDSMPPSMNSHKTYKYVALDAKKMPDISDKEVQYILTYFKGYNDKTIFASIEELKRLGLCTPFRKDLRGGILLAIDEVIEITNEKAILEVSYHVSGLGAGGFICTLAYKDNRWQVESLDPTYIA
jgi:hypothetical protein